MTETPQTPEPAPAEAQAPAPAGGEAAGPGNGLGIASLVVGIVSAVIALIPGCGAIAFVPAIVGLVLGVINVVLRGKANLPKGVGMAGIILNVAAIVFILAYLYVIIPWMADKVVDVAEKLPKTLPASP